MLNNDPEPLAREEARLSLRAARAVRAQAKQPGWLNAHGLRRDFYTEKLTGSKLIDRPGWGEVESEVLTRRVEEYVPPPPPDLSEALTNDKNAFKPGFNGRAVGPTVPQLSRASQRKRQEEAAKESAKKLEEKRIADAIKAVDDAATVADLPIPYIEGRSDPREQTKPKQRSVTETIEDRDDEDDDEAREEAAEAAAAMEDQMSRTLWTQAHNHDMMRGNPRGRRRAVEVMEANEKIWSAIPGVRRVRTLKDDPVGWAAVIEFHIGVNIPEARFLPPLWVDGVRVIIAQPGSRNRNKAASLWGKVNAKRRVEAMTKAFKAAVPKEPPPRKGWGSNVDPSKKRVKAPLPRSYAGGRMTASTTTTAAAAAAASNGKQQKRTEAERVAARRVAAAKRLEMAKEARDVWETKGFAVKIPSPGDDDDDDDDEDDNKDDRDENDPRTPATSAIQASEEEPKVNDLKEEELEEDGVDDMERRVRRLHKYTLKKQSSVKWKEDWDDIGGRGGLRVKEEAEKGNNDKEKKKKENEEVKEEDEEEEEEIDFEARAAKFLEERAARAAKTAALEAEMDQQLASDPFFAEATGVTP